MDKTTRLKARLEEIDMRIGEITTLAQKRIDRLENQAKKIEEQIRDIEVENEIHDKKPKK